MDGKDAVKAAKLYLADLLADEKPADIGLEELEYTQSNGGVWLVTLGFSRPWDRNAFSAIAGHGTPRSLRIVTVRDEDGKVLSLKRRDAPGR